MGGDLVGGVSDWMDRRQRGMVIMKRRRRAPDSSSSTFRQRPRPDGQTEAAWGGASWGEDDGGEAEIGGGWVGQRDTCGRQNLLHLSRKYRETLSFSHTAVQRIVHISVAISR